jgi:transcriptional regulator with XRE-family HTH domain
MPDPVRTTFARLVRETRIALDITQQELAAAVGVTRGYVATIERDRGNPSLAMADRFAAALGIQLDLVYRKPVVLRSHGQQEIVHARCVGYLARRLRRLGWETASEVEIVHGRSHGWIDLLAFDPRTRTLLIIEIKTRIDDLGGIERQMTWYERVAYESAIRLGWSPRRTLSWLVALASDEVDAVLRANAEVFVQGFPHRSDEMLAIAAGHATGPLSGRGLALCDPVSRRRDWLIRTRLDGRRSELPYRDYADAARRLHTS